MENKLVLNSQRLPACSSWVLRRKVCPAYLPCLHIPLLLVFSLTTLYTYIIHSRWWGTERIFSFFFLVRWNGALCVRVQGAQGSERATCGIGSLSPPHGFKELNSGHWAWPQVSLPLNYLSSPRTNLRIVSLFEEHAGFSKNWANSQGQGCPTPSHKESPWKPQDQCSLQ